MRLTPGQSQLHPGPRRHHPGRCGGFRGSRPARPVVGLRQARSGTQTPRSTTPDSIFPITEDTAAIGDLLASPGTYYDSGVSRRWLRRGAPRLTPCANVGASTLDWTASSSQGWVAAVPSSGTLAPGAVASVDVTLTAAAAALPSGAFSRGHDLRQTPPAAAAPARARSTWMSEASMSRRATAFAWLTPRVAGVSDPRRRFLQRGADAALRVLLLWHRPRVRSMSASNGLVSFLTPTGQQATFSSSKPGARRSGHHQRADLSALVSISIRPSGARASPSAWRGVAPDRTYVGDLGQSPGIRDVPRARNSHSSCKLAREFDRHRLRLPAGCAPRCRTAAARAATIGVEHQGGLLATHLRFQTAAR